MIGDKIRPDKKNKTGKHHNCNYTTFLNVTIPNNNYNKDITSHFIELLCWKVEQMMNEDPRLMVIPYPNHPKVIQPRPVEQNAAVISSLPRAKYLTDQLWIQYGIHTKIKLYIFHNCLAVTFIAIKFRDILDEKDIKLRINPIQASKTVCAVYLLGSVSSVVNRNWCSIINKHPKLATIDFDVKHDLSKLQWMKIGIQRNQN